MITTSGYTQCSCRDCFEIAVGIVANSAGVFATLCSECEDAGCSGDGECSAPGAYGGDLTQTLQMPAISMKELVQS